LIELAGSSSNILVMKKLFVLLLVIAGLAFVTAPPAQAGVHFVFGLPVPVPFFYGPSYYGPGPYYGAPYGYGYGYGYYGHGPYWRRGYYRGYHGYYGRRYYAGRYNGRWYR
jgi:hypothetical protein